jgi:hypothetical protein
MIEFSKEEVNQAIARIGNTPDGRLFRAMLVSILLDAIPPGQSDGAVREGVGRLNFAREVLSLLDRITDENGTDSRNARSDTLARSGPGSAGPRGARRRGG